MCVAVNPWPPPASAPSSDSNSVSSSDNAPLALYLSILDAFALSLPAAPPC